MAVFRHMRTPLPSVVFDPDCQTPKLSVTVVVPQTGQASWIGCRPICLYDTGLHWDTL